MRPPDQSLIGFTNGGALQLPVLGNPTLLVVLGAALPLLWLAAIYLYRRSRGNRLRDPIAHMVGAQCLSAFAFAPVLGYAASSADGHSAAVAMIVFWAGVTLTGAIGIWSAFHLLDKSLEPYPGIYRVAIIVLRWVTAVALLLVANRFVNASDSPQFDVRLQRLAVGIGAVQMVVALLVIPCTYLVRRSVRSRYQDVLLGLVMIGFADTLMNFAPATHAILNGSFLAMQLMVVLATVCFWVCCFGTDAGLLNPATSPWTARALRWSGRLRLLVRVALPNSRVR